MFSPKKNGTVYKVMDAFGVPFECHLPAVGYGWNPDMQELAKTDVIKRSVNPAEQYWEREPLPDWYDKKREQEEIEQDTDPDFVDPDCEKVREKHWRRRLFGVWFYNNGKPAYLTGLHWFTLNWWPFQGKFFDFRIPNMEYNYVLDYVIEDPNALGLIEVTKRKEGKTARAGAFLYEYTSRTAAKHGGIQSKTDDDAQEVFQKAVTAPWRKLPHFFRPIFDTGGGDDPKGGLRFFLPSKKGRRKKYDFQNKRDLALESFIDYASRKVMAYDGPELHRYVSDESGKLIDVSIVERHNVVKFCSEVDGNYVGKQLYTTTVEEMESGGSEFRKLVKMSDRRELNANGRTKSGLYCYFLPAFRTMFYDRYGFPNEERGKLYYMNTRDALKNEPRELSSDIRKNPFTLAEAFRVDGVKSLFNPENLNYQLDYLSWNADIVERGDLVWKDGERFTEVLWKKNPNGRFHKPRGFHFSNPNRVEKRNGRYYPANNLFFRVGCDPFKYDKVKDNRRSDCAAFGGQMFDPSRPNDPFNDSLVVRYRFRAATTGLSNEDILKLVWILGCQVLFERNVDHWKAFFIEQGCEAFLMKLPGEDEYGVHSDGHGNMLQAICNHLEDYVENSYKKLWFKETVEEYLEFDVGNTTKSDETIASGITRLAMIKKSYRQPVEKGKDISDYFKMYKAS